MTGVTLPGSAGTVSFKYDPFGRRIEKISPTTTSIFAYDGTNPAETVNSSGAVVARYVQGRNVDEPLAMQRGTTTDYYEQDGIGSVTSLTNAAGAVAQTYTYDSFGNTTNSSGSLANPFRYTGREFDTETNLYYNRARYLDSATGRFLSEDPLRFSAGANFYRFVGNSPLLWRDPDGKSPDWGGLYNSFASATNKLSWLNCFITLGGFSNTIQDRHTYDQMTDEQALNTAIALQQDGKLKSTQSNQRVSSACSQDQNLGQGITDCASQTPIAGPLSAPSWLGWILSKL